MRSTLDKRYAAASPTDLSFLDKHKGICHYLRKLKGGLQHALAARRKFNDFVVWPPSRFADVFTPDF
jgi:hypothetical protein